MEKQVKGSAFKSMGGGGSSLTVEALAAINALALEPLAADDVYTRSVRLVSDAYDRDYERVPAAYLARFAETLPGKAFLACHSGYDLPSILGRFYSASVCLDMGVSWLDCSFYMRKTPANQEVRDQIDAGVYAYASVGFLYADLLCDLCQQSYWGWDCCHYAGDFDRKTGELCTCTYGGRLAEVEAIEGSLVYLGAQYGAAITKGSDPHAVKEARRKSGDRAFVGIRDQFAAQLELHRLAMDACL